MGRVFRDVDWVITVVLAAAIAVLDILGVATESVTTGAILLVLATLLLSVIRTHNAADRLYDIAIVLPQRVAEANNSQVLLDAKSSGVSRILPDTISYDWESEIDSAREVTIVRLRLNLGERGNLLPTLQRVLDRNGTVTIVIADPRSPAMWLKYMEEPKIGSSASGSETAWAGGLEELALEVARLDKWITSLKVSGKDLTCLQVRLSRHFPGQAYMRFDRRVFTYPYPYGHRGYHGPAFEFDDNGGRVFAFVSGCIDSIVSAATPLTAEVVDDVVRIYRLGLFADRIVEGSTVTVSELPA